MEVVATDEKNVRRAIRTGIGEALRSYYGDLSKEPVPGHLADLLLRLDEPDKAYFEKQE
jgi:hypothetical protein